MVLSPQGEGEQQLIKRKFRLTPEQRKGLASYRKAEVGLLGSGIFPLLISMLNFLGVSCVRSLETSWYHHVSVVDLI